MIKRKLKKETESAYKDTLPRAARGFFSFIASSIFLKLSLLLFALQGVWFAVSIKYPIMFDERMHFEITQAFTDKWLPYLTNESAGLNYYQDLEHRAGLLYHFVLSFPLRIIELFAQEISIQVTLLRLINVGLAVVGLMIYVKLLKKAKLPNYAINLAVLLYAMLPMTPYIASTINYDNAIFVLFPLFTLAIVNFLNSKKADSTKQLLLVVLLGCTASLMKYTFLPIFLLGVVYILFMLVRKKKINVLTNSLQGVYRIKSVYQGLLVVVTVVMVVVFSSVYIKNLILFGSPNPKCNITLNHQTCMKNAVYGRNYESLQTKDDRETMALVDYVLFDWVKSMSVGFGYVAMSLDGGFKAYRPPPVMYNLIGAMFLVFSIAILARWRKISKNTTILTLSVLCVGTAVVLLVYNINSYYHYHDIFANHARYLIFIMPLFLTLGVYTVNKLLQGHVRAKFFIVVVCMVLLTQGGGALSYIVKSEPEWFSDYHVIHKINDKVKSVSEKLIIQ